MTIPIYQVDAFTDKPFSGNPAAVCLLPKPFDAAWMQNVAQEMNLSETAFLLKEEKGFNLRWFTPETEVELCGHATLASAHILWENNILNLNEQARFNTHSGLLTAKHTGADIELNFPAIPEEQEDIPSQIAEALGVIPKYFGQSKFDYLIEVDSEETVRNMNPDFHLLKTVPARGVIVTAITESPDYDFVSRFFAPAVGIDEDPVTGSAHGCLGPFWSKRLGNKTY